MRKDAGSALIGLDVNASWVRAVAGVEAAGQPLALEGEAFALPAAVGLEGRRPEAGRAGAGLCRRLPHLLCHDFLAALGTPRQWSCGRHRLDAARALGLVFERLHVTCGRAQAVALALPAYLTPEQAVLAEDAARKARLRLAGAAPSPLAAALAAYAEQPWTGLALVGEVDDHALAWTALDAGQGGLRLLHSWLTPRLGLTAWKERLLEAAAQRCIGRSRRDPRDCPAVEQALYDQLDDALDACRQGHVAELRIQAEHWYQDVLFQAQEVVELCAGLTRQALTGMQALLAEHAGRSPAAVVLTAAAGRLPGLARAVEEACADEEANPETTGDFGEALLEGVGQGAVRLLAAEAVARGAHALAARWERGELEAGYLDGAPLPAALPPSAGPPRLQFRGHDYPLRKASFLLGRHPGCDLVFDSKLFPNVSGRHCELVREGRSWLLRDLSRNGTFVNNRPVIQEMELHSGDWVRLGASGPLLRFLGQALGHKNLVTTA